jgi:hypothetical protein
MAEFTDVLKIEFERIDLVDEDIQSRIYDRYLRTEVVSPNEVRSELGFPERTDGDDVLPFPTKVKKEGPGAPAGNSNNASAFPAKSPSDRQDSPSGDRQNGDQAERGQNQDLNSEV